MRSGLAKLGNASRQEGKSATRKGASLICEIFHKVPLATGCCRLKVASYRFFRVRQLIGNWQLAPSDRPSDECNWSFWQAICYRRLRKAAKSLWTFPRLVRKLRPIQFLRSRG